MRGCAIAGCEEEGVHSLGVRCRLATTRALWAPNLARGLCDVHARQGLYIRLELETLPNFGGIVVEVDGEARAVAFSEAVAQ